MEDDRQVDQLEAALLRQAEVLAKEHLANGEAARARIRSETEARLKLLEEREVLTAKAQAERLLRRRVQAAETRMATDLDRLRWNLTESALDSLQQMLAEVTGDAGRYRAVLEDLLAAAARELPPGDLVVEVGDAEAVLLGDDWEALCGRAAPGRQSRLSVAGGVGGGLCVRLADDRARLDQTFVARAERQKDELARVAMERLFASTPDLGALVRG